MKNIFGPGFLSNPPTHPSISRGNYNRPGLDSDIEERMLFKLRNTLERQIKSLDSEDSPYSERAREIEGNLKTVIMFVERQIYDRQLQKERVSEMRRENSERLLNPVAAAQRRDRKNFRMLVSANGRLLEMERLLTGARNSNNRDIGRDMTRRAMEISVELKRRFEP